MKIIKDKVKYVKYKNKKLYVLNTIDKEKLNEYSEFMIGSVTKIFTIFLLLILQQKKLLNINDQVNKYVKSNRKNDFSKITILDLMNHQSGMIRGPDDSLKIYKAQNVTEVTELFIKKKLFIHNKHTYNYSNYGFLLLGRIIESVTNMSYLKAYQKYLFIPLKLNNTGIGNTNIKLYNFDKKKLTNKEYFERYMAATAGGLYSCISDLITFFKKGIKLLNNKSIKQLKSLYIYSNKINNINNIRHNGLIWGGYCEVSIAYDKKWKVKDDILISFETNLQF